MATVVKPSVGDGEKYVLGRSLKSVPGGAGPPLVLIQRGIVKRSECGENRRPKRVVTADQVQRENAPRSARRADSCGGGAVQDVAEHVRLSQNPRTFRRG